MDTVRSVVIVLALCAVSSLALGAEDTKTRQIKKYRALAKRYAKLSMEAEKEVPPTRSRRSELNWRTRGKLPERRESGCPN